ncbi:MAG: hypothetical protein RI907_2837 [Pseudomonadota bacterium]|jgi:hypothetical protein
MTISRARTPSGRRVAPASGATMPPLDSLEHLPHRLRADLVDLRHATAQPVRIWLEGGLLQIAGPQVLKQVPWAQIDWFTPADPTLQRMARLPDGSRLCAVDATAWDLWLTHCNLGHGEPTTTPHAEHPSETWLARLSRRLWLCEVAAVAIVLIALWNSF